MATDTHPRSRSSLTLYCFSPAVMIATFVIETALAIHTFWKYRHTAFGRLALLILACLAAFQIAEYNICTGPSDITLPWTKFGLIAITLLPALGIHLASLLMGRSRLLVPAYLCASILAIAFAAYPQALRGAGCTGNYVILDHYPGWDVAFGAYYWVFLLGLLIEIRAVLTRAHRPGKQARTLLTGIALGYLTFIAPMAAAYSVSPGLMAGTASIMCGFAVIWAVLLTGWLVPRYHSSLKRRAG